jgi:hypothetical protein
MRRLRVYADTSVFGGVLDDEFSEASRRFFDGVRRGGFLVIVSSQVLQELDDAPDEVRAILEGLPEEAVETIAVDAEAEDLADAYLSEGVIGPASRGDAIHVAAATVAGADLILSWNFRHIVRLDRIRMFNGVNALKGYGTLDVRSPLEVAEYGR